MICNNLSVLDDETIVVLIYFIDPGFLFNLGLNKPVSLSTPRCIDDLQVSADTGAFAYNWVNAGDEDDCCQ